MTLQSFCDLNIHNHKSHAELETSVQVKHYISYFWMQIRVTEKGWWFFAMWKEKHLMIGLSLCVCVCFPLLEDLRHNKYTERAMCNAWQIRHCSL